MTLPDFIRKLSMHNFMRSIRAHCYHGKHFFLAAFLKKFPFIKEENLLFLQVLLVVGFDHLNSILALSEDLRKSKKAKNGAFMT